jgi:hypothetical protein
VFAVVEDEEHVSGSQKARDRVGDWPFPLHGQSERGGDRLVNQFGPVQRRQLDKACAVREARQQVGSHLQRQAGLPDTAGSDQRDQTISGQQRFDLGNVALTSDQCTGELGQIAGIRWRRLGRWPVRVQAGIEPHNECLDRPGDVF